MLYLLFTNDQTDLTTDVIAVCKTLCSSSLIIAQRKKKVPSHHILLIKSLGTDRTTRRTPTSDQGHNIGLKSGQV